MAVQWICVCFVFKENFLCLCVLYNSHRVPPRPFFSSIMASTHLVSDAPPRLICELGPFGVDQYLWGFSTPILNLGLGLCARFDLRGARLRMAWKYLLPGLSLPLVLMLMVRAVMFSCMRLTVAGKGTISENQSILHCLLQGTSSFKQGFYQRLSQVVDIHCIASYLYLYLYLYLYHVSAQLIWSVLLIALHWCHQRQAWDSDHCFLTSILK